MLFSWIRHCPEAAAGSRRRVVRCGDARRKSYRSLAGKCEALENRLMLSHGPQWIEEGPRPITGGRVVGMDVPGLGQNPVTGAIEAIAAHPTNPNTVYIGGVGGSVWKTENATSANPNWRPLTDDQPSLAISDIALDPLDPQTIYAGTGSYSSILGTNGFAAAGLLKSPDGGNTWTVLGAQAFGARRIRSVVPTRLVGPSGQVILVALDDGGGLFRSTDGGINWMQVSGTSGTGDGLDNDADGTIDEAGEVNLPAGSASHLVADPGNANRFFLALPGLGVFRSEDGGATWVSASFGIHLNSDGLDNDADGRIDEGDEGVEDSDWIELGVHYSPGQDLTFVYAAVLEATDPPAGPADPLAAVFLSAESPDFRPADIWSQVPGTFRMQTSIRAQHFSFLVDVARPNVFFIRGEADAFRVEVQPNAANWVPILRLDGTEPHKDSREMVFDANGNILQSDDGGISRLVNPADPSTRRWVSVVGDLGLTEFVSVAYDPFNDILFGGNQDNGGVFQSAPSNLVWPAAFGGDGGVAQAKGLFRDIDADGTLELVGSIRFAQGNNYSNFFREICDASGCMRRNLAVGGLQMIDRTRGPLYALNRGQILSPSDAPGRVRMLLAGSANVYESFDAGDTLSLVTHPIVAASNSVFALDYGTSDNPTAAILGTGQGNVLIRELSGATFVRRDIDLNADGMPDTGFIQHVAFDPNNSQIAYVVDTNNIYRTTDAGQSWNRITSNLVRLGIGGLETIEVVPRGAQRFLIMGGRSGIAAALDTTTAQPIWVRFGSGFPNVFVDELSYDSTDDVLAAATTGRGAWVLRDFRSVTRPGIIFGYKFNDFNGNGVRDDGEPGLPGWTIYIDSNGDGVRNSGEPFRVTDADGLYSFTDLIPGHYTVSESPQSGWVPTSPAGGTQQIALPPVGLVRADFGNSEGVAPILDVHLFYNNSSQDGNGSMVTTGDFGAIDPTKKPLRFGETATFTNVSGYTRGINGIFIDMFNLPGGGANLDASDFLFRTGNSSLPDTWGDPSPDPMDVGVFPDALPNGVDRIYITFQDGAVRDTWLRITIKANADTGLALDQDFFFGSVPGDTGAAFVGQGQFFGRDAADLQAIATELFQQAAISDPRDINRDGIKNAFDLQAIPVASGGGVAIRVIDAITPRRGVRGIAGLAPAVDAAIVAVTDDELEVASFAVDQTPPPARLDRGTGAADAGDRDLVFSTFGDVTPGRMLQIRFFGEFEPLETALHSV